MIEKHYFKALFLYLDPEVKDKVQTVSKWTAAQLVELQIHALNIISNLVALAPQHIYDIQGHRILAVFLHTYNDKPRRKAAMLALLNTARFDEFKTDLADEHLLDTVISIIENN